MSILIIGDVHGREFWKDAVAKYADECDKIIFLGDYLDPYPWENITRKQAIWNFEDIIKYKEENKEKVKDMTYMKTYYLKGNIYMEINGMAKDIIKIKILNMK